MSTPRTLGILCALALSAAAFPAAAQHRVDEKVSADPEGPVEVQTFSGTVEVSGWDQPQVAVTGTVANDRIKVDLTSGGGRTSVRLVPNGAGNPMDEAHLVIHMPARSALTATLVSADLKLHALDGAVKAQSISGNITGDVGGDVKLSTVSGDLDLAAPRSRSIELRTISGDIKLTGGTDEVDVGTVSGTATLDLATVSRGRFKSVSGDFKTRVALAPDARLDGESVSGDLAFDFAAEPAGGTDVQTFSGSIDNCFGPKPVEPQYGPGSRLTFRNGEGRGQIHIDTKSGDVKLCVQGRKPAGHTHGPVKPT